MVIYGACVILCRLASLEMNTQQVPSHTSFESIENNKSVEGL